MIKELMLATSLMLTPAGVAVAGESVYHRPYGDKVNIKVLDRGQKKYHGASLYTGRFFVARTEALRRCIRWHESRHAYGANNGTGKYRGAYQLSKKMGVGAGWMIQRELRLTLPKDSAIKIGRTLRASKVNDWSMYWQDMAFWLVWNHGDGRSHWAQTSYKVRSCS